MNCDVLICGKCGAIHITHKTIGELSDGRSCCGRCGEPSLFTYNSFKPSKIFKFLFKNLAIFLKRAKFIQKHPGFKYNLIRLEYHFARKTDAKTWYTYNNIDCRYYQTFKVLYNNDNGIRTHIKYWILIPEYIETLTKHRISNSGNYYKNKVNVKDLLASIDEIPPKYLPINTDIIINK